MRSLVVVLLVTLVALGITNVRASEGGDGVVQHYVSFSSATPISIQTGGLTTANLMVTDDALAASFRIERLSININNLRIKNFRSLSFLLVSPSGLYSTLSFSCGATSCPTLATVDLSFNEEASNEVQDLAYLCSLKTIIPKLSFRTGICSGDKQHSFPSPYQQDKGFVSLNVFDGEPITGEWKLLIEEGGSNEEESGGHFDSWSIEAILVDKSTQPQQLQQEIASLLDTQQDDTPVVDFPTLIEALISDTSLDGEKSNFVQREEVLDQLGLLHPTARATNGSNSGLVQQGSNNVVYFDQEKAAATFYYYEKGQVFSTKGYTIILQDVRELDSKQNLLNTWTLPTTGYAITNPGSNIHVYTLSFMGATFTFTFTYHAVTTIITFGSTSFATYGDSSLLNVKIENWNFQPTAEFLQFTFGIEPVQGTFKAPTFSPVAGSPLKEVTYALSDNSFTARYTVLDSAILDGTYTSGLDFSVSGNLGQIILPKFTTSAEWDPDFGILVENQNSGGDGTGSNNDWIIAVAVSVPAAIILVFLIIIIILVVMFFYRRRLARAFKGNSRNVVTFTSSDDEENPNSDHEL